MDEEGAKAIIDLALGKEAKVHYTQFNPEPKDVSLAQDDTLYLIASEMCEGGRTLEGVGWRRGQERAWGAAPELALNTSNPSHSTLLLQCTP